MNNGLFQEHSPYKTEEKAQTDRQRDSDITYTRFTAAIALPIQTTHH